MEEGGRCLAPCLLRLCEARAQSRERVVNVQSTVLAIDETRNFPINTN